MWISYGGPALPVMAIVTGCGVKSNKINVSGPGTIEFLAQTDGQFGIGILLVVTACVCVGQKFRVNFHVADCTCR